MNGQSVDLRCDVEEWRACGEEENESGNGSRKKRDGRVELHICRADAKTRSRLRFTTLQPSLAVASIGPGEHMYTRFTMRN